MYENKKKTNPRTYKVRLTVGKFQLANVPKSS